MYVANPVQVHSGQAVGFRIVIPTRQKNGPIVCPIITIYGMYVTTEFTLPKRTKPLRKLECDVSIDK